MGDEMGLTKDEAHECIMRELLEPKIIEHNGKVIEVYSTKNMKVKDMSDYLNRYQVWASSFMGVNLPLPEEMHYRG
jgi:hypothetical protein